MLCNPSCLLLTFRLNYPVLQGEVIYSKYFANTSSTQRVATFVHVMRTIAILVGVVKSPESLAPSQHWIPGHDSTFTRGAY